MGTVPQTELNRKISPHNFSVTLDAGLVAQIPSGRNRKGLIIGNTTTSIVYVNFNELPIAAGGIPIQQNFGRLELNGLWYGDAMTSTIWVRGGVAGDVIQCTEFVESP